MLASEKIEEGDGHARIKVKGVPDDWPGRFLKEGLVDAVIVEVQVILNDLH